MATVRIEIRYQKGVEDPEALTIKKNLNILGFDSVSSVSTLRSYEIKISPDVKDPVEEARKMAEKLLVNPVIHEYRVVEVGE